MRAPEEKEPRIHRGKTWWKDILTHLGLVEEKNVCYSSGMQIRSMLQNFGQKRLVGGAIVLAGTQFTASIAGLVRDRLLAATFPKLEVVDVYLASFRPSDLLFQMCIMAGFSVALVPLLAKYHAQDDKRHMSDLLTSVVAAAAMLFGVVALLMAVFFEQIAPLLVNFEGGDLTLYIQFGRLALLTNFLFVFGNAFGQYLVTVQRYWIYGLTPVLYTLGTIAGTIWLTPYAGEFGPILGTVGGAVLYVFVRLIGIMVAGYRFRLSPWHPDLSEFYKLMWPRMMALGALQLQLLLFDKVASGLDAGSITINAYARNFQAVAVGLAGIALAQSAYSILSQAAQQGHRGRYWVYLRKGIIVLLILTIPGAIALVFLAPFAAKLVALTHVLPVFSLCLLYYSISIPFESINHLLLRAYYATKHTLTPACFSVVNGFSAIAIAWWFAPVMGVYSLALGFTVGQVIQMVGLGVLLPARVRKNV